MKLAVSFLSVKTDLPQCLEQLDHTTMDFFHLDLMDGIFVPNSTCDLNTLKTAFEHTTKHKDIHLMVEDIGSYVEMVELFDPTFITFHYEASIHPMEMIAKIKELGIHVGMSIKPNTPVSVLTPYLPYLDLVLLMSVEPGKGGQSFLMETTDKIDLLVQLRDEEGYHYLIEVDGGINADTVSCCKKADMVVVGSFITNQEDYQKQIDQLGLIK